MRVVTDGPCRVVVVETVLLKRSYVLVLIEHAAHRLHLGGVSTRPTGEWAGQQARNLVMDLGDRIETLRFLIHDRDPLFTAVPGCVHGRRTADHHHPWMNAVCERVIGTLRRELLDRILGISPPSRSRMGEVVDGTTVRELCGWYSLPDSNRRCRLERAVS